MNTYLNRRNKLLEKQKTALVIVPSAELKQRSNDTEYPFRQNSNFFYLIGFNEHNSILMLKKEGGKIEQTIFLERKFKRWSFGQKRLGGKKKRQKTSSE